MRKIVRASTTVIEMQFIVSKPANNERLQRGGERIQEVLTADIRQKIEKKKAKQKNDEHEMVEINPKKLAATINADYTR